MLRIGSKVKIIGLPDRNDDRWLIPHNFVGLIGTIVNVTGTRITVNIEGGGNWYFPLNYTNVLELIIKNKWNPMNYVSPFEPLKLP